jgi:hypothetical protein
LPRERYLRRLAGLRTVPGTSVSRLPETLDRKVSRPTRLVAVTVERTPQRVATATRNSPRCTSSIGTRVGQWLAAGAAIAGFTIGVAISSSASAYANPDPSAPAVVDVSTPPLADNSAPPSDEAEPPADNSAPPTGETEKEKEAEVHNRDHQHC